MRVTPLFVYGSLLTSTVLHALLGRRVQPTPASLHGYRRTALRGRPYPGIVPDASMSTSGHVLALRPRDLRILDRYEDDHYSRRRVTVTLEDGRHAAAQVYVLRAAYRGLGIRRDWSPQAYARRYAAAAARQARAWRAWQPLRHT